MAAITIKDLNINRTLDRRAMSFVRGGNGSWVFGWIRPYVVSQPSFGPVINFYQVNNYAEQMINQIQVVDVTNSAANSNINIALAENSSNTK
ncbi:MAG TPA: hypothetical protein VGE12_06540 [Noviherbaspirillum sp.]